MALHEHFRQALVECDVNLVRKIWQHAFPGMPQPGDDADVLRTIHYARTVSRTIEFKHRAYSHCWLKERSIASGLPDALRPKAERMYPRIVEGVGIAVKTMSGNKALATEIRTAMENVVLDCFANGDKDPLLVKNLMLEARAKVKRGA